MEIRIPSTRNQRALGDVGSGRVLRNRLCRFVVLMLFTVITPFF